MSMIDRLKNSPSGSFQPSTELQPICPMCRDTEFIIFRDEEGYELSKFCECRGKKQIDKAFKSSKITFEFQTKSFDNFDFSSRPPIIKSAYMCAKNYMDTFEKLKTERQNSIALLGRPGCGKTHLLMAVSNGLIKNGIQVLYFPWVEGFNEIKDDLSLTEERINKMQKVDVLYIDDMWKGRKNPTDFQIEQAFAVINHRYMEKKPILISSERDIDDMCEFDEGIGSRINEMAKDFKLVLKGGKELNYRLKDEDHEPRLRRV
jgi:DNA replication protein DnaC